MQSPRHWLLALVVTAAHGCTDLTPPAYHEPDSGPIVTVANSAYRWSVDSAIVVNVVNPSGAITFTTCGPYRLQRYHNGWQEVRQPGVGFADFCVIFPLASQDTLIHAIPLTNDYVPWSGWYASWWTCTTTAPLGIPGPKPTAFPRRFTSRPDGTLGKPRRGLTLRTRRRPYT